MFYRLIEDMQTLLLLTILCFVCQMNFNRIYHVIAPNNNSQKHITTDSVHYML